MPRSTVFLAFTAMAMSWPAAAHACEFLVNTETGMQPVQLSDMNDGIVNGTLGCGSERLNTQFWTMSVDTGKSVLGVRDGKLFETRFTGPLSELLTAQIEDHVDVSVHERTETVELSRGPLPVKRHRFRRYVTFCDAGAADPLNCSLGDVRVKARVTFEHADDDGYLDASMHEISFFDGVSKLHVMSFITPYSQNPTGDISRWIEAINAVSDVLQPQKAAALVK
jgi:hypothetical protein